MKLKRAVGALTVAFAAIALPLVVASPASADQGDCQFYLIDRGYKVGPKVVSACKEGAEAWGPTRWPLCYYGLVNIGVRQEDAAGACTAAGW
ncbi:hypothetical protein ACFVQ9_30860 [Streptomyces goshikiensis]|uniref:hypothetical protein n=1 Tax=Streptomyces goshikiensis TaxID=1942 RepID=UPI0036A4E5CF